jgi:hypothetical protein
MRNILRAGKWLIPLVLVAAVSPDIGAGSQEAGAGPGGGLLVNADEAEGVLAIVEKNARKQTIEEADWQRLFASEPYVRLKKREAEIAVRFDAPDLVFNDGQFKAFVLGAELAKNVPGLRRTLREWEKADMGAIADRLLEYLPAGATIKAKVYPVVKPRTNSFVYELDRDPAIFLYLDPRVSREKFENTLAHELHHIGFASVESRLEKQAAANAVELKAALKWLSAFGEGFAMLAAAGGPDVDPHRFSDERDRARWRKDMANFNEDLGKVDNFFLAILNGRMAGEEKIDEAGSAFFGIQGPWYTVGYKMACMVEKREGRAALIRCMEDPRLLLKEYNRLAAGENKHGARLALWSAELLEKLGI